MKNEKDPPVTRPAPTRARGGKWRAWACLNQSGELCESLIRPSREACEAAAAMLVGRSWHGLLGLGCRIVRVEIREVPREVRARRGAR